MKRFKAQAVAWFLVAAAAIAAGTTFYVANDTTQPIPIGGIAQNGNPGYYPGQPAIAQFSSSGYLQVSCADGTCSGGGGSSAALTLDGGRIGAIDWIDGGFITATVNNFPASFNVGNQQAQWTVIDGGYLIVTVDGGNVLAQLWDGTNKVAVQGAQASLNTDITSVRGVAALAGLGLAGNGAQRVVIAQDNVIQVTIDGGAAAGTLGVNVGNFPTSYTVSIDGGLAAGTLGVNVNNTVGVSGTLTCNEGGAPWTQNVTLIAGSAPVIKAASTAAAAADQALVVAISPNNTLPVQDVDLTSSGALGALNAAVTVATAGTQGSFGIQFPATNTLVGTLVPECSADKGTTWPSANGFFIPSNGAGAAGSIVAASTPTSTSYGILCPRGTNGVRVRVSAFTSGTVTPTLAVNLTGGLDPVSIAQGGTGTSFVTPMGAWAIDTSNTKEAYLRTTNAQAGDPALVVALSPNSVANGAAIAGGRGVMASDVIRTMAVTPITYSCATAAKTAVVANTLPFTTLCGSATRTVRVQKVRVSATVATTAVYADYVVKFYSTGPTGGTTTALTKIPHDSSNAAATATGCVIYTAAPTDGTAVGVIDGTMAFAPVTATLGTYTQPQTLEYFARTDSEAPTLRGTAQCLTINFGTTPTNAPTVHAQWTWTEE